MHLARSPPPAASSARSLRLRWEGKPSPRRCFVFVLRRCSIFVLALASFLQPQTARHPERSCSRHFVSNAVEGSPHLPLLVLRRILERSVSLRRHPDPERSQMGKDPCIPPLPLSIPTGVIAKIGVRPSPSHRREKNSCNRCPIFSHPKTSIPPSTSTTQFTTTSPQKNHPPPTTFPKTP